jgi:uncharacterized membrane protein
MSKKFITKAAMIAALYVVLTFIFSAISFGPIQVRLAMSLQLFSFFTPAGIIGAGLGTLISNILFGGLGVIDMVLGTISTVTCASMIYGSRKALGESIWPVAWTIPIIPTAVFVSIILNLAANIPMFPTIWYLMAGNTIAMFIGFVIFGILRKNKALMDLIKK